VTLGVWTAPPGADNGHAVDGKREATDPSRAPRSRSTKTRCVGRVTYPKSGAGRRREALASLGLGTPPSP